MNIHNPINYNAILKNLQDSRNKAYEIVIKHNTTSNKIGKQHCKKKFIGPKLLKEIEYYFVTFWNGVVMGSFNHIGKKIFIL